jgi:transcriptional regulator with XRE-family HTH domain
MFSQYIPKIPDQYIFFRPMLSFKDRLLQRRKDQRLSQDQLAHMIGKSGKAVISSWELGRSEPSLTDIKTLAEKLKTTSAWLIDGIDDSLNVPMYSPPEGYTTILKDELISMQQEIIRCRGNQAVN